MSADHEPAAAPPRARDPQIESPAPQDESDAAAMFFRMSAARLRSRCLLAGLVLMASILVPYEVLGGRGIFVWSVIGELGPASQIAALTPAIAGFLLFLLGLRPKGREGLLIERPTSRAIAVLAIFLAANGALFLGREASAWGILPLPDSLTTRPAPFLAVFALTAAGSVLRFHARARKGGSALLLASLVAALVFYVWPSRGEIPAQTIGRALVSVITLSDARYQIGYGLILLFVLSPLVIACLGLVYVNRIPGREHPGLAIAAVWAVPGMMLLFVYRSFITGGVGVQTITTAFFALLLVAVVAPLASALEVLMIGVTRGELQGALSPGAGERAHGDLDAEILGGARPIVAGAIGATLVTAFLVTIYVLGRPAPKGVDWKLGPATDGWDKVFSHLLPSWQVARLVRDRHARSDQGTGAEAMVATKARAREMLTAAKAESNGSEYAAALDALASDVDDLELSGRAFGRLVAHVNDAARRSELPYYLDPEIRIFTSEETTTRIFTVTPYRVHEVHGYRVGKDRFATLLVDAMTVDHHSHLGFSRDQDPFALVERSEIKWYSEQFTKGESTCGRGREGVTQANVDRCDSALRKQLGALGDRLETAILAGTERHELQHQIDGPHLPLAGRVIDLLEGYDPSAQDRVNREASAFLAELTTKSIAPKLTLVMLAQHIFGSQEQKGVYAKTAIVVLEALSGRSIRRGSFVDGDKFWAVYDKLFEEDDDKLRARAKEAWEEMFDTKLPQPKLK